MKEKGLGFLFGFFVRFFPRPKLFSVGLRGLRRQTGAFSCFAICNLKQSASFQVTAACFAYSCTANLRGPLEWDEQERGDAECRLFPAGITRNPIFLVIITVLNGSVL